MTGSRSSLFQSRPANPRHPPPFHLQLTNRKHLHPRLLLRVTWNRPLPCHPHQARHRHPPLHLPCPANQDRLPSYRHYLPDRKLPHPFFPSLVESEIPAMTPPAAGKQDDGSPLPPAASELTPSPPEPAVPLKQEESFTTQGTPGEPATISPRTPEPVVQPAASNLPPVPGGQKAAPAFSPAPTQPQAASAISSSAARQPPSTKMPPALIEDDSSSIKPPIIARQPAPAIPKPSAAVPQGGSISSNPPTSNKPGGKVPTADKPGSRWELVYILVAAFVILAVATIAGYISIQNKARQQAQDLSQAQQLQETLALAQTLTNLPFPTLIPTWTLSPTNTELPTASPTGTATYTPTFEFTPTRTPRLHFGWASGWSICPRLQPERPCHWSAGVHWSV